MRACVRACVCVRVRACVRACVCVCLRMWGGGGLSDGVKISVVPCCDDVKLAHKVVLRRLARELLTDGSVGFRASVRRRWDLPRIL